MAVVDIQGAPPGASRFKAVAPLAAGALGVVAAIVGAASLTGPEIACPGHVRNTCRRRSARCNACARSRLVHSRRCVRPDAGLGR